LRRRWPFLEPPCPFLGSAFRPLRRGRPSHPDSEGACCNSPICCSRPNSRSPRSQHRRNLGLPHHHRRRSRKRRSDANPSWYYPSLKQPSAPHCTSLFLPHNLEELSGRIVPPSLCSLASLG